MGGCGSERAELGTGFCGPRPGFCFGGSVRIPRRSSSASTPLASWMRLLPLGVCQPRCSQMVWPSSVRLSLGKLETVSWMPAIWRLVRRLPRNVVDLRRWTRGSIAGAGLNHHHGGRSGGKS